MEKKYCIFDMDGTLVDSMGYWERLGIEYLVEQGVDQQRAEQAFCEISSMTLLQAVEYFIDSLKLPQTPQEMIDGMQLVMEGHYRRDIQLKPGVEEYLTKLKDRGCKLCVATATAEPLAKLCLERLGIAHYFEFLLSCETLGVGKGSPDIYLLAAGKMGSTPEETAVFEDALYAAATAKKAGFYTVGIKDGGHRCCWEELSSLADQALEYWQQAL